MHRIQVWAHLYALASEGWLKETRLNQSLICKTSCSCCTSPTKVRFTVLPMSFVSSSTVSVKRAQRQTHTNTHLNHANLQLLAITASVDGFLTWNNEWLWFPYPRMSLFTTNRAALHAVLHIVPTCLDCSPEWTKYILWSFSGQCTMPSHCL